MALSTIVCLVDDDADYRLLVEAIFKRSLPTVSLRLFVNGRAFLDELPLLDVVPNLIILDQHMPFLNGYQTLLDLKQGAFKLIPVVMMSADASHSEIHRAYDAGARFFMRKPTDFVQLRDALLEACQYASPASITNRSQ